MLTFYHVLIRLQALPCVFLIKSAIQLTILIDNEMNAYFVYEIVNLQVELA